MCDLHKGIVVGDSWSVGVLMVALPCPIGDTAEIECTIISDPASSSSFWLDWATWFIGDSLR
jgi:hypothetical protein